MLHGVLFQGGEALSYCNHWLRCPRFVHEKEKGENIYIRVRTARVRPHNHHPVHGAPPFSICAVLRSRRHRLFCDGWGVCVQIGDIRGLAGLALLALTQQVPWMFPEPDEYLNYQLGNTSLCWHNGRLLALMEGGMPFQAHVGPEGAVSSVGPYNFDGAMTSATSGHPKVCPITGEMHSFFYR